MGKCDFSSPPVMIIDQREKLPFALPNSQMGFLKTADYSILGFEDRIAFERKTLTDLLGCIGGSRDRFERELQRLSHIQFRGLIVEATLREVLTPPPFCHLNPSAVLGTLVSWALRFQLPIWLAGTRSAAQSLTERLLTKAAQYAGEGYDIE
jgi:DNA excision repair protein ERCC-4